MESRVYIYQRFRHTVSIFRVEGLKMETCLPKVGLYLGVHTVSQPRRVTLPQSKLPEGSMLLVSKSDSVGYMVLSQFHPPLTFTTYCYCLFIVPQSPIRFSTLATFPQAYQSNFYTRLLSSKPACITYSRLFNFTDSLLSDLYAISLRLLVIEYPSKYLPGHCFQTPAIHIPSSK